MSTTIKKETAIYHGLEVEVICMMDLCALVCYKERKFIVDTADLVFIRHACQAA